MPKSKFIQHFFTSILVLLGALCSINFMYAQNVNPNKVDTGKNGKDIVIIHADRRGFQEFSDSSQINYSSGNVAIRQGSTLFYCDSVSINIFSRIMESFGHVHIIDNDTVNIYSDYARYESLARKASLQNNVKLSDSKSTLTTIHLDYDLNTKTAIYKGNGKLVTGKTVLTSVSGAYFTDTKDATFSNNVILTDPQYNIKTDTLLYNTASKIATFVAPTHILSGKTKSIQTSDGYYDMINKKAYFAKRPVLVDSSSTLIADEVAADDSTGFGEARGQVVYKDTVQKIVVLCGNLKSSRIQSSFLATINPVAIIIKDTSDSTFIAADTLYSARYMDKAKSKIDSANIENSSAYNDSATIKTILPLDSTLRQNKDTARVSASDSIKKPIAPAVGQVDSTQKISTAPPTGTEIKKPAKKKKSIFDIFKKNKTAVSPPVSPLSAKADTAQVTALNAPAKIIEKEVQQMDISGKIPTAPPSDTAIKTPEKKKNNILSIFKKIIPTAQKDTIPISNKDSLKEIENENSGKQTPSIIDSLKNNPAKSKNDSLNSSTQTPANIDLSPNTETSKKDSIQEEDNKSRFLEAYYNVRIFNDSVQAIGDSLYYDSRDSLFQLFKSPVVWTTSNNQITQISGDTIDMYTANSKPKYLKVWYNAIAISQSDTAHRASTQNYFNQMSGRTIESWFTAGELDSIAATGNALAVYYLLDEENKYKGVNTQSQRLSLTFYFSNKEPDKIAGRREIVGRAYPMMQVNHEAIRLKGFKWQEDKRPKSKYELLERK